MIRSTAVETMPSWIAEADLLQFPPLSENLEADVGIVGGGIAGMTTAYLLAQSGKSVVVVDHGPVGGGMTHRTTAHLTTAFDDRYFEIEKMYGRRSAQMVAESQKGSINQIEAIVQAEKIECEFRRLNGYLFAAPGQPTSILDQELEASRNAGLPEVEKLSRAPIRSFDTGICLRYPDQAQVQPVKYLAGLTRAAIRRGVRVFTGTHVERVEDGPKPALITSSGHRVLCDQVVIATNSPITDLVAVHTKQAPYTTYVIAADIPRGLVEPALFWDTADPYHYVRLQDFRTEGGSRDLLIVGGEDHKSGQGGEPEERWSSLESWTRERFPINEVVYRWSGQVMEPADGLAFIGPDTGYSSEVYIATGDSGQGITYGTIAGLLLRDLMLGTRNHWAELFDPGRTVAGGSPGEYAKENLNVALQYTDWLTPGEVKSVDEIAPGEGALIRDGFRKIAAYRDRSGQLHQMSATCKHLGCLVHWNSAERTWDCPCHGSKYDRYGRVIIGPAQKDLEKITE